MRVLIDASNIRMGGGITHLSRLLAEFRPGMGGIHKVEVWSGSSTLSQLSAVEGVHHCTTGMLEGGLFKRALWQQFVLPRLLATQKPEALFSPGGTLPHSCPVPAVTMSQNMLPFEPDEARRFGLLHPMRLKLALLKQEQGRSFSRADGVIFLSEYARSYLNALLNIDASRTALIPHGMEARFLHPPKLKRGGDKNSHRLLYVSILMPYKHQLEVGEAVMAARNHGVDVVIDFIGASWGSYGNRVAARFAELDPSGQVLRLRGAIPFDKVHDFYRDADSFLFASSCENLPNILIEAMASGLPIASSNRGPMPEVLGDTGLYFDPYSVESITHAIIELIQNPQQAYTRAAWAYVQAQQYSWQRCAEQTFTFIGKIAGSKRRA